TGARRYLFRSDDATLPEPLRGFRLGFGLAEGQVVITRNRQLIPVLGTTTFRDSSGDSDPAGPVQEAVRHGASNPWSGSVQIDQAGHSDKPVQDPRVKFAAISFPAAISSASSDTSYVRRFSSSKVLGNFIMVLLLWLKTIRGRDCKTACACHREPGAAKRPIGISA